MSTAGNKEVSAILRTARGLGWMTIRNGRHWKLAPPPGESDRLIVLPRSPSDHRWMANFLSTCRRHSIAGEELAEALTGRARPEAGRNVVTGPSL